MLALESFDPTSISNTTTLYILSQMLNKLDDNQNDTEIRLHTKKVGEVVYALY